MSKIQNIYKDSLQYFIVVGAVLLIALVFSHPSRHFSFQNGSRWNNDDLYAEIDFDINKSTDFEISEDKYVINTAISQEQIELLQKKLTVFSGSEDELNGTSSLEDIVDKVRLIFENGIAGTNVDKNIPIYKEGGKQFIISDWKKSKSLLDARKEIKTFIQSKNYSFSQELSKLASAFLRENVVLERKEALPEDIVVENGKTYKKVEIKKGTLLIKSGAYVNSSYNAMLQAYEDALNSNPIAGGRLMGMIGYLLLTILSLGALLFYLKFNYPSIISKPKKLAFVFMWPVLISFLVYIIDDKENLSTYLIPFCIVPIIVKNFFDDKLALFLHVVIILIASYLSKLGYEFAFLEILAGIVAVLIVSETRYWNKFFISIFVIFGTFLLGFLGLSFISVDSFSDIHFNTILWFVLSALLTLLAYPFIPLLEKIFGFTSSISLAELADMNHPLLKEMSIKAPGTFQHSLQVSNLAEAAASKIGANSVLIKTAALFHDIGKLKNPSYFIENQSGHNPHDDLTNFESAKMIISHVTDGVEMAKKAKLPQIIIDFIASHHGSTRVEYFYRNQMNQHPDAEFDESLFRYPGPKPKSKEEAILMIADSIEAASKSLKSPTGQDIDKLVDGIIAHKISLGQLEEANLSFNELEKSKRVFKTMLRSINHVRVEYPKENKNLT